MEPKGIVAASQPRWIIVKDRMPESYEYVLIYDTIDAVCIDYHDGRRWAHDHVTHWMPLPEPPREVHND